MTKINHKNTSKEEVARAVDAIKLHGIMEYLATRLIMGAYAELLSTTVFLGMSTMVVFSPNKASYVFMNYFEYEAYMTSVTANMLVMSIKLVTTIILSTMCHKLYNVNLMRLLDYQVQKFNVLLIVVVVMMTMFNFSLQMRHGGNDYSLHFGWLTGNWQQPVVPCASYEAALAALPTSRPCTHFGVHPDGPDAQDWAGRETFLPSEMQQCNFTAVDFLNSSHAGGQHKCFMEIDFRNSSYAALDFHSRCNYTYIYDKGLQLCSEADRSFRSSWGVYDATDYI